MVLSNPSVQVGVERKGLKKSYVHKGKKPWFDKGYVI
jgi:hypothetical protein